MGALNLKTFKIVFEQIELERGAALRAHRAPWPDDSDAGRHRHATFHLDDRAGFLNRRTIVLHKTTAGWKIVHLHASEVAVLARQ